MSDLIDRLRSLADCDSRAGEPLGKCMREAADQITALRASLEAAEAAPVVNDAMMQRAVNAYIVAGNEQLSGAGLRAALRAALTARLAASEADREQGGNDYLALMDRHDSLHNQVCALTDRLEELEANEQSLRDMVDEGTARLEAAEARTVITDEMIDRGCGSVTGYINPVAVRAILEAALAQPATETKR